MPKIYYKSNCIDLKKIEDDYLDINLHQLTNNEIKYLFRQRRLYNPNTGTRRHWLSVLEEDVCIKNNLWRRQYKY